jgi:outer membrane protein OmpA-like peptidoglycan-associated protein
MKNTILPLLAATTFAFTSCDSLNKPSTKDEPQEATADTAVVYRDGQTAGDAMSSAAGKAGAAIDNTFDMTRAKLADRSYPEIKQKTVTVRGDEDFDVYSVDEKVLFDTDKATVKPDAAAALKEIMASISQRYANKDVRVMGFADSRGDAKYNFDLAKQRAEAVKNYLVETGKMAAAKVSTESFGEQQPAATNTTPAGRQENRRVEIAVRVR